MSGASSLSADELRFINLVATRRLRSGDPMPPEHLDQVAASLAAVGGAPHERAAAVVEAVLRRSAFRSAPAETALLAMLCQLRRDGLDLVAPQGAVVGMVQGMSEDRVDAATLARWLEDRALPLGSGF